TDDLGSLDIGSPIFYRRIKVGQVVAYDLDSDGRGVTLRIFVNAPYDKFVTQASRFWHASGFDMELNASGFKLHTQALSTVVLGGIAFRD
ncbi:MlaD family protein, partial [Acinetobacter baumannii]